MLYEVITPDNHLYAFADSHVHSHGLAVLPHRAGHPGVRRARQAARQDPRPALLPDGDRITGEIKRMEKGNIHIEPDYADNVFVIV